MYHLSEEPINQKGFFVGKLSPHDSSLEALFAKLGLVWLGYFVSLNLQEWLTLIFTGLSVIYMSFNIYVLVRDKILRKRTGRTDFGTLDSGKGD